MLVCVVAVFAAHTHSNPAFGTRPFLNVTDSPRTFNFSVDVNYTAGAFGTNVTYINMSIANWNGDLNFSSFLLNSTNINCTVGNASNIHCHNSTPLENAWIWIQANLTSDAEGLYNVTLNTTDNSTTTVVTSFMILADWTNPVWSTPRRNFTYFRGLNESVNLQVNVTDTYFNFSSFDLKIVNASNTGQLIADPAGESCYLHTGPNLYTCNLNWTPGAGIGEGNFTFNISGSDNASNWNTTTATLINGSAWFLNDSNGPAYENPSQNYTSYIKSGETINLTMNITDMALDTSTVTISIINATDTDSLIAAPAAATCTIKGADTQTWVCERVWTPTVGGNFTFNVTATDLVGNSSNTSAILLDTSVWFVNDSDVPIFNTFGKNDTYLNASHTVSVWVNVTDKYLNTSNVTVFFLNASATNVLIDTQNMTCAAGGGVNSYNCSYDWTPTAEGNFTFNVTAWDYSLNSNSSNDSDMWFVNDESSPLVNSPVINDTYLKAGETVQVWMNVTDAYLNLSHVNVTFVNVTATNQLIGTYAMYCKAGVGANSFNCSYNWTPTQEGNFTFNVSAWDYSMNFNNTLGFSLDTTIWVVNDSTLPVYSVPTVNDTYLKSGESVNLTVNITDIALNTGTVDITIVNATDSTQQIADPAGEACTFNAGSFVKQYKCSVAWVPTVRGNFTFNVTATDMSGNANNTSAIILDTSVWFVNDSSVPIFNTFGKNDTYLNRSQTIKVWVNVTDLYLNTSNVTVFFVNASATNVLIDTQNMTCAAGGGVNSYNCSYDWTPTAEGNFTFNVTAWDYSLNSNSSNDSDMWFVNDESSPLVNSPVINDTYLKAGETVRVSINVTDAYLNLSHVNVTFINVTATNQLVDVQAMNCVAGIGTNSFNCTWNWTPTTEGNFTFNVTAWDYSMNFNNTLAFSLDTTIWVVNDSTAPIFYTPAKNDTYLKAGESINLTINISDIALNTGTVNFTIINATNTDQQIADAAGEACTVNTGALMKEYKCSVTWTPTVEGNFSFNVSATDMSLNVNNTSALGLDSSMWFLNDSTIPVLHTPSKNDTYMKAGESINLTMNITDFALNTSLVNFTIVNATDSTQQIADAAGEACMGAADGGSEKEYKCWVNWTPTIEGNFTFNVSVTDMSGNANNTSALVLDATMWFLNDSSVPLFHTPSKNDTYMKAGESINLTMNITDFALSTGTVNFTIVNATDSTQQIADAAGEACMGAADGGREKEYKCSVTWTPTIEGNFTFNVTATDLSGNANNTSALLVDTSMWFLNDSTIPVLHTPSKNDTHLKSGESINLTMNITDFALNTSLVNFTIVNASNSSHQIADAAGEACMGAADGGRQKEYKCWVNWTPTIEGNFTFNVSVTDMSGNANNTSALVLNSSMWFVNDSTTPGVSSSVPDANQVGVGGRAFIEITFDEKMNGTFVNNTTFYLNRSSGTPVYGYVENSSDNITFVYRLTTLMVSGTWFNASIINFEDRSGNPMNYSWKFRTADVSPGSGPTGASGGGSLIEPVVIPLSIDNPVTIDLAPGEMISFTASGESHVLKLLDAIPPGMVELRISSTPQDVTATVTKPAYVDLNGDNVVDLYIQVDRVKKKLATLTLRLLRDDEAEAGTISESTSTTPTAPTAMTPATSTEDETPTSSPVVEVEMAVAAVPVWTYLLVALVVIVAVGYGYYAYSKGKGTATPAKAKTKS